MSTQTVRNLFTSYQFSVPAYQRDYAWEHNNIDDLFGDIEEALLLASQGEQNAAHYLGTFILAQPKPHTRVQVVDGQQRLTTLTMLLDALIDTVDDPSIQQYYRHMYIEDPVSGRKFEVQGANRDFFAALLDGWPGHAETDGQERLKRAYEHIQHRVSVLKAQGGESEVLRWIQCIERMEVLVFLVADEGRAIRMFQSVNDRGVPLSRMDIVKSLLVYYSNRYLNGELDMQISEWIGEAFKCFARIKRLAREDGYQVRTINRKDFTEDQVLRYHYLSFDTKPYQLSLSHTYWITSKEILEQFLKPALQELRSYTEKLKQFIIDYTRDLCSCFQSLLALVEGIRTNRQLYVLFVIQDLSTTLYPLTIRLNQMGWLDRSVPAQDRRTLLELVECVDMRVYKLRGTNPEAKMYALAASLPYRLTAERVDDANVVSQMQQVVKELQDFTEWGMSDAMMIAKLPEMDLYHHPARDRLLLAWEDYIRDEMQKDKLSTSELADVIRAGVTAEHILAQDSTNSFDPLSLGFYGKDDYELRKDTLGNLVWLETSINSTCSNRPPHAKATHPRLYPTSRFAAVQRLSAQLSQVGVEFDKSALIQRSQQLAIEMVKTWPIRV